MALSAPHRAILQRTKPFTVKSNARAALQVGSTLGVLVAAWIASALMPAYLLPLLVPVYSGVLVRIFVLQHDCGHGNLFKGSRWCDRVGYVLSLVTTMPHLAWKAEHNWHHAHQGKLSKRGVDNMNSPMMVDEIPLRPEEAAYRVSKIRPLNIFLIGAHSFLIERKQAKGFFPFRPSFTDRVAKPERIKRHIVWTIVGVLLLQATLFLGLGWMAWGVYVLSAIIGAGIGGSLFWVQHNFEHTYYQHDESWNPVDVALKGSSFLKLGPVLTWCTAHIGHHHVHHLNPGIPNYNLERARREIPELADVRPISREALRRSYTHLFWDPEAQRMRPMSAPHED